MDSGYIIIPILNFFQEIEDWECANTKVRYEIYQLQKQLKEMTAQLASHDCKLNGPSSDQKQPEATQVPTTVSGHTHHTPTKKPLQDKPHNITSQPKTKRAKIQQSDVINATENNPAMKTTDESPLKKRRSKRKRRVSSRILT